MVLAVATRARYGQCHTSVPRSIRGAISFRSLEKDRPDGSMLNLWGFTLQRVIPWLAQGPTPVRSWNVIKYGNNGEGQVLLSDGWSNKSLCCCGILQTAYRGQLVQQAGQKPLKTHQSAHRCTHECML